ncbi:glutamate--cysteine ligase [Rubrobacter marinus]|uniref:Glutamate--cysteine ligase n=1 Tax=Rubrobacter marinus TaxID=2653852 RepID=A0A6G8PW39_9ACTN|nr:glutamate-cysteine ligase family protein [Rubrobacter marinus]QIN78419.1 glutamate--cysteine ligase [Rubrobacter marinus]
MITDGTTRLEAQGKLPYSAEVPVAADKPVETPFSRSDSSVPVARGAEAKGVSSANPTVVPPYGVGNAPPQSETITDTTRADALEDIGLWVPTRRIGLEQEFFLVDEKGELRQEADRFLGLCREEARETGLDPSCFKGECAMGMVEILTPPSPTFEALADVYLSNLSLALRACESLGLRLYPLGTYPLPAGTVMRNAPRYWLKSRVIGRGRFLHAGRCAGTHLHLELPPGTAWPDVKVARDAREEARREMLDLYNLATAFDPALVALTRSCPFYEGRADGLAARTARYRGGLGVDGVYATLQEVGGLAPYAEDVEDLVERERRRARAWFGAMGGAGVERRLFARTCGVSDRFSWNPVRLSRHGTVEIRTMDSNLPEVVLAACATVYGAAERLRRDRLRVKPTAETRTLEVQDGELLVPSFDLLSGRLLRAAVEVGAPSPEVAAYLDSLGAFARPLEGAEMRSVGWLKTPDGGYATTESRLRSAYPYSHLTREEGLDLVLEACGELEVQVSALKDRFGAPHDEPRPEAGLAIAT